MTDFRDEKCVASAHDRVTKRHRLGRGGRFVEQRGIGDVERGQVGDHRLEIEQRFEPALRDLGLIRRVGGVPAGIFQDVALDDRRHDAIGVAGANEVADDFVLLRDSWRNSASASCSDLPAGRSSGFVRRMSFGTVASMKASRFSKPTAASMALDFLVVRADVTGDKTAQFLGRLAARHG